MADIITEDRFSRFKGAIWFPEPDTTVDVVVGGAGGIGSWLTTLLTRAGFDPAVYDDDTIEAHNIGGQLYSMADIGKKKVTALADLIKTFCNKDITTFDEKFTDQSMAGEFMFSGFDNMKARKDMFDVWFNYMKTTPEVRSRGIFMDGRLTMDQATIFCVPATRYEDVERYKKFLFDDSEVEDAPCTLRQTSHSAALIASHMVAFFTNHLTNVKLGEDSYELPFFYEYHIPSNLTNLTPNE